MNLLKVYKKGRKEGIKKAECDERESQTIDGYYITVWNRISATNFEKMVEVYSQRSAYKMRRPIGW